MAVLLTKIWKSVQGQFFETELEALTEERKHAIKKAVKAAYEAALEQQVKVYEAEFAAYNACPSTIQRQHMRLPQDPRNHYTFPPGFMDLLADNLEVHGVLPPIKTSGQDY